MLSGKTALVTGATGAIGGAAALAFSRAGAETIILGRDPARLQTLMGKIQAASGRRVDVLKADLSNPASVRSAVGEFEASQDRLHILANLAAVFTRHRQVTPTGLESMFATNHLGPFLLTNLLLSSLTRGAPSRIINVSAPSTVRLDFDDLQGEREFSSLRAFGASKMANLLFTFELARRLGGTGVTCNVLHPGVVRSGLMKEAPAFIRGLARLGARSPEVAGEALLHLASAPDLERVSGRFFKGTRPAEAPKDSLDRTAQTRLWDVSARLAGLEAGRST